MVGIWTLKVKIWSNTNQKLSWGILGITQIYSLFFIISLYLNTAEYTNLETKAPADNLLYSLTWQKMWDCIQVFNGKDVEQIMKASAGTQSFQHLGTRHFRKCIRLLSTAHSHALFRFLDSLTIQIFQLSLNFWVFSAEI